MLWWENKTMKWITKCRGGFLKKKGEFLSGYIEKSQKWGIPRTDFSVAKFGIINKDFKAMKAILCLDYYILSHQQEAGKDLSRKI